MRAGQIVLLAIFLAGCTSTGTTQPSDAGRPPTATSLAPSDSAGATAATSATPSSATPQPSPTPQPSLALVRGWPTVSQAGVTMTGTIRDDPLPSDTLGAAPALVISISMRGLEPGTGSRCGSGHVRLPSLDA
jgi:hypothetical protein